MKIAPEIVGESVEIRRRIHRVPELSGQEFRTRDLVLGELQSLGFEVRTFPGSAGVAALWPGRDRSRCLAFRADMDALPLEETSGLPWASESRQAMHACGHDGHTSILLGFAKHLARSGTVHSVDVKLLFQPSEESGNGARQMVLEGALEAPATRAVFALHGWPDLPVGRAGVHRGAVMASVDNFELMVLGRGGHGAQPHQARDPIFAAAQLVSAAQSLISRSADPLASAVLTFGHIQAGRTYNVIPEECRLLGTLRSHAPAVRESLKSGLDALRLNLCRGLGMESRLTWVEGCPATLNDGDMADVVRRAALRELGAGNCVEPAPSMAGEDFSFFLEKVPGAYFWLGLGDGRGSLHNPRFDFNDEALETGIRLFAAILEEWSAGDEASQ